MEKRLHSQFLESSHKKRPDPQTLVTGLIAIEGKIPVFRRSKGDDIWFELPGGKPEPEDRDIVDTIVREMWEELGIVVVADTAIFDTMPHPFHQNRERLFIKCHHIAGEPHNKLPDEHLALHMLSPEQAIALVGPRITAETARALRELSAQTMPKAEVKAQQALELKR
jgi:8-oxo-dGTP pyrophosphatase MutT (NUDIX family)